MFAKSDEIQSLPVQVIKAETKCRGLRLYTQRAITLKELTPSPYFSIINVHLVDINVFANFVKFHYCLFKLLKNQNVMVRQG